jgi:hypothetical protein
MSDVPPDSEPTGPERARRFRRERRLIHRIGGPAGAAA